MQTLQRYLLSSTRFKRLPEQSSDPSTIMAEQLFLGGENIIYTAFQLPDIFQAYFPEEQKHK